MNHIFRQVRTSGRASTFAQVFLFLVALATFARAHPIPDIPVRTFFAGDGTALITVEVEPRCMGPEPDTAPSMLAPELPLLTSDAAENLKTQAAELVKKTIEFYMEPGQKIEPNFNFRFTGKSGSELKGAEDVVVLTGEWRTNISDQWTGWKVKALPASVLSVVFQNIVHVQVQPRLAVLFPGETSFTFDLNEIKKSTGAGSDGDAWKTFVSFVRQGFIHVLPLGVDHILFVLGVFLLSRRWKPLLAQVTTFTLAHSVTLALATLGVVHVPASIVEPIIAASIAVVALENVFHPKYTHWRLALVFLFGLIHGLGFAGALSDLELPTSLLATGLVGFNVGVECAQLAVIGIAFALTFWLKDNVAYRNFIVIPGSIAIALCGLWWTIQRIFG